MSHRGWLSWVEILLCGSFQRLEAIQSRKKQRLEQYSVPWGPQQTSPKWHFPEMGLKAASWSWVNQGFHSSTEVIKTLNSEKGKERSMTCLENLPTIQESPPLSLNHFQSVHVIFSICPGFSYLTVRHETTIPILMLWLTREAGAQGRWLACPKSYCCE